MHIHEIGSGWRLVIPDLTQQQLPRQELLGVAHQILQELELARQKLDLAPVPVSLPFDQIKFQGPHPQARFSYLEGASEQGLDTRGEFGDDEGLDQIIIATGHQSVHAIADIRQRAQNQQRHPAVLGAQGLDRDLVARPHDDKDIDIAISVRRSVSVRTKEDDLVRRKPVCDSPDQILW